MQYSTIYEGGEEGKRAKMQFAGQYVMQCYLMPGIKYVMQCNVM